MKKGKSAISLVTIPIPEILKYFEKNSEDFTIKLTNYSLTVVDGEDKYLFSTSPISKKVFIWYNLIKKDNAGEIRNIRHDFRYYDFSGIAKTNEIQEMFCVDINSAYLSVLKRDSIISENTFSMINQLAQKKHRLQSVGMFARNPVVISIKKDIEPFFQENTKDPFEWIFFHAVRETWAAMEAVKKEMQDDFLFYWVDGIFLKGNPEKAISILQENGFLSKIEHVKNFKKNDKYILFDKEGKKGYEKKILFLPKNNYSEKLELTEILKDKRECLSRIKNAIQINSNMEREKITVQEISARAKEIRKKGEDWQKALQRATNQLKKEKSKIKTKK